MTRRPLIVSWVVRPYFASFVLERKVVHHEYSFGQIERAVDFDSWLTENIQIGGLLPYCLARIEAQQLLSCRSSHPRDFPDSDLVFHYVSSRTDLCVIFTASLGTSTRFLNS